MARIVHFFEIFLYVDLSFFPSSICIFCNQNVEITVNKGTTVILRNVLPPMNMQHLHVHVHFCSGLKAIVQ
jgi:hypothetical protein